MQSKELAWRSLKYDLLNNASKQTQMLSSCIIYHRFHPNLGVYLFFVHVKFTVFVQNLAM